MSKRILVIINSCYPYDTGESFLESEIPVLKSFDNIYLFPCSVQNNYLQTRNIENDKVEVAVINRKYSKYKNIYQYLSVAFKKETLKEIKMVKGSGNLNLSTFKALLAFSSYGNYIYRQVKNYILERCDKEDKIIFYSYWMHFHAFAAVKLTQYFKNSAAVTRCHGYDIYEYRNPYSYLPFRNYIIENMNKVYCICDDGKRYLEERFPSFGNEIIVSRLGSIDHGFKDNVKSDTLKIVSCSWISPVKRIERIIDSLSEIKDINIEWTHYGDGEDRDKLEKRAASKLSGNIKYNFYGKISNSELMNKYKEKDYKAFINVSESEGVPVSIMEAASFGIPSVATAVGGVSEIISDKVNGFLLDKDFDNKDLINVLYGIKNMDEKEYVSMRLNARKMWEEKYNAVINYKEFEKSLIELLN